MNTMSKELLLSTIFELETKLEQQKKTSKALLDRVKKNLKYQLNANETFEHNSFLLGQIKKTKQELLQQAQASEKYSYLARHDSLTSLYNRDVFNKKLKNCVDKAKQNNETHSLFFLDLDQFKVINDTAGHLAGDEMLKQIASILMNIVKENETLARLGGDEFGIICQNCTKKNSLIRADEFLSIINQHHFYWGDKLFRMTASIGLIIINKDSLTDVDVQKNVDLACYAAKNAGRNRVHLFEEKDDKLLQQYAEMQWVPKLTKALKNNLFVLYAQPIKPTQKDIEYHHYEILVRLQEGKNIILPGVFLPPAERYNLITKIDTWVIIQTFKWLSKNINKFDPNTYFSINLSGQSLCDENILILIIALLEEKMFEGKRIHFEVTETMAISNLQTANNFIREMKQYGCGFSLDDFGSGLSSLSYLKNLDVDILKVDGVFIRDIINDPIDQEMVSSINNIGHVMGMETVAEYVENQEIADKLTDMGFDYLQGHCIGMPKPLSELLNDLGQVKL